MCGLDNLNTVNIIENYLTLYNFKYSANLENWELISKLLISQYCDKPGNENKTLYSLVGKHISEFSGYIPITRDQ